MRDREMALTVDRLRLEVTGEVQGVGFRPFAFRLAQEEGVGGRVYNTRRGAVVEIEGPPITLDRFVQRLRAAPPPIRVKGIQKRSMEPQRESLFRIVDSHSAGQTAPPPADLSMCPRCRDELFDPGNRRYRYPFTACSECGPRFSIIESVPYDRERTTLRRFPLCPACAREYEDPRDRRFHAQATGCPDCGPQVELWGPDGEIRARRDASLGQAAQSVRDGAILAVKGLGGFHLVVDARRESAVARLRRRKCREEKPFAVMVPHDFFEGSVVSRGGRVGGSEISEEEINLLRSPEGPIVLLRQRPRFGISPNVAPGNPDLGLLFPTTPLHAILVSDLGFPVVATSGNRTDEPICIDEKEAVRRLAGIADFFLVHDRPIARPVDDSVARTMSGKPVLIRRARGYAPTPLFFLNGGATVLAMGGHMKNTLALARGNTVALGSHGGDLDTPQALDAFQKAVEDLPRLHGAPIDLLAADGHPDYTSTRYAQTLRKPVRYVQHHHAHFASCLAENGVDGPALGVVWDGSGWGPDGTVWGGEFLVGGRARAERFAHFRTFSLAGGEAAMRDARRSALGLLFELKGRRGLRETPAVNWFPEKDRDVLARVLERNVSCVKTSSVGRLFDGVSALLGTATRSSFEGQAAMALEFAAENTSGSYAFHIGGNPLVVDWGPLVESILTEMRNGVATGEIAGRFHNTLLEIVMAVAGRSGLKRVALSGGCFQNVRLLENLIERLSAAGHEVLFHRRVPTNDGGLSLGQAAVVRAGGGSLSL